MMIEAVTAGKAPSRKAIKSFVVYILVPKPFRP